MKYYKDKQWWYISSTIEMDLEEITKKEYDKAIEKLQSIKMHWLDITEISDKEYKAILADNEAKHDKAQKEKADAQAKILKRIGVSAEEFRMLLS